MATKRRMPCEIDVDTEIQNDILEIHEYDYKACDEIGVFLEALQVDPLPKERTKTRTGYFYVKLACGYYVAWEVLGDSLRLVTTGDCKGILVRVLGVGREEPKER